MELVWEEEGVEQSVDIGPDRPEILLGRHKDCDIRVRRASVSRRHCLFQYSRGGVVVTDQNSTAGTYIEGEKVSRVRIDVGTAVNCGGVMVLLDEGVPAAAPAPAPTRSRAESGGGRRDAADIDALFDDPPPSRRSRSAPQEAPPKESGRRSAADIDALFDDPPVSRRSRRGRDPEPEPEPVAAPEPAPKKSGGFDPDAFFGGGGSSGGGGVPVLDDADDWKKPKADGAVPLLDEDDWKPEGRRSRRGQDPEPEPEPEPAVPAAERRSTTSFACYLLFVDDDGAEAEVRVEREGDPVMVGRRSGAAVKVRNPSVSGKHCTVGWMDDDVVVRDLGSSNGTFINNDRVRRGSLRDGDILRCGRFELRVSFVELKDLAQAEYEEWADDDWGDDDEMDLGPPRYHLLWSDDRGEITAVTMDETERTLAIGSRGCEINIENRDVEGEHCELNWDEGILVVNDLQSETGTFVNDESVEEETIRSGDVLVVGYARIHIVRGCSSEKHPPAAEKRSEDADLWVRHLDNRDDDLEILFVDGEEHDEGGKHELSVWGNGEARLEVITEGERYAINGTLDRDLRRLTYEALLRAGFPDVSTTKVRGNEVPAEINVFQRKDEARVVLSKALVQRSPGYHEVLELLRAICTELATE